MSECSRVSWLCRTCLGLCCASAALRISPVVQAVLNSKAMNTGPRCPCAHCTALHLVASSLSVYNFIDFARSIMFVVCVCVCVPPMFQRSVVFIFLACCTCVSSRWHIVLSERYGKLCPPRCQEGRKYAVKRIPMKRHGLSEEVGRSAPQWAGMARVSSTGGVEQRDHVASSRAASWRVLPSARRCSAPSARVTDWATGGLPASAMQPAPRHGERPRRGDPGLVCSAGFRGAVAEGVHRRVACAVGAGPCAPRSIVLECGAGCVDFCRTATGGARIGLVVL